MRRRSAQTSRGISRLGKQRVCRRGRIAWCDFGGRGLRNADTFIEIQVFLGAARTIALTGILIAQAGQFVTAVDTVAVASRRCCFDGYQCHVGLPSEQGEKYYISAGHCYGYIHKWLDRGGNNSSNEDGRSGQTELVLCAFAQFQPDGFRKREKHLYHLRVELCSAAFSDFPTRIIDAQRFAVRPIG
jgi:hypothetical protein